jgi:hypothetical protein
VSEHSNNDKQLPTPKEMADVLRLLPEDTALDLLRDTAEMLGGWTPELNAVGLHILKPDAPEGEEGSA